MSEFKKHLKTSALAYEEKKNPITEDGLTLLELDRPIVGEYRGGDILHSVMILENDKLTIGIVIERTIEEFESKYRLLDRQFSTDLLTFIRKKEV